MRVDFWPKGGARIYHRPRSGRLLIFLYIMASLGEDDAPLATPQGGEGPPPQEKETIDSSEFAGEDDAPLATPQGGGRSSAAGGCR